MMGLTTTQWLIFFGMLAGAMIAVEGISRGLISMTASVFKKWKLKPNQHVLLVTTRSLALGIVAELVGTWFWYIGFSPSTTVRVAMWMDILSASAFVIGAYRMIDLLCTHVIEQILRSRPNRGDIARTLAPLVSSTVKVVIIFIGLTVVLGMLGVNVLAIITGLSIGGAALALASQDTIKNFFGSMMLLADHPFDVGDLISVDGVDGTVEEIGFRSTRLRTAADSVVSIPNGTLANMTIDNLGVRSYRLYKTDFVIDHYTPTQKVQQFIDEIRSLISTHPLTLKDPAKMIVAVTGVTSVGYTVTVSMFVDAKKISEDLVFRHEMNMDIMRAAENLRIRFSRTAEQPSMNPA